MWKWTRMIVLTSANGKRKKRGVSQAWRKLGSINQIKRLFELWAFSYSGVCFFKYFFVLKKDQETWRARFKGIFYVGRRGTPDYVCICISVEPSQRGTVFFVSVSLHFIPSVYIYLLLSLLLDQRETKNLNKTHKPKCNMLCLR